MAEPEPTAQGSAARDLAWIALAAAPGLAIAAARQIGVDFWYDEVRTLRQVVLVPLETSATDYLEPNNHVLFSILANLWCRLIGVGDLAAALDRPEAMRLLPFLLAAPGPILLGAAVRRRLGVAAGAVAAALFASALPFANFACQFRGYGLGLTLVSAMLLFAIRFKDSGRTRELVGFAAAGALAVFAIPLHLYAIAAVALLHGAMWTARLRRGVPAEARLPDLHLVTAAVAAGGIGLALYIPCIGSVLSNHWSEAKAGGPHVRTLTELMPPVLAAMVAGRLWILAAIGAALVACWLKRGPQLDRAAAGLLAWGTGLLLVPFVVSTLRGDRPFDRVFLQVLPAFAIAGAAAIRLALGPWHGRRWVAPVAVAALSVGGWLALDERDRRLAEDIERGEKSQFIERAYFHAHYKPRVVAEFLRGNSELAGLPVVLGEHDREALPAYLRVARVEFKSGSEVGWSSQHVLVTSGEGARNVARRRFEQVVFRTKDGQRVSVQRASEDLSPTLSFDRIFLYRSVPQPR